MNRISDVLKIDQALTPQSLNGAGTGQYFMMNTYRRALFTVNVGAMAAAATAAMQAMQAKDSSGTDAKVITGLTATITANTKVSSAKLLSGDVHVAGEVYTINGLAFTAAAADVPTERTYAVGASATTSTANLAAKINHATLGVPGVLATADTGTLTLTAIEPGEIDITISASVSAVGVPSTLTAVGYLEVEAGMLDDAEGFDHVALRVTNSAAMLTGAGLLRECRETPTQYVAASDVAV